MLTPLFIIAFGAQNIKTNISMHFKPKRASFFIISMLKLKVLTLKSSSLLGNIPSTLIICDELYFFKAGHHLRAIMDMRHNLIFKGEIR